MTNDQLQLSILLNVRARLLKLIEDDRCIDPQFALHDIVLQVEDAIGCNHETDSDAHMVHCKDCKYLRLHRCPMGEAFDPYTPDPDGYCYLGCTDDTDDTDDWPEPHHRRDTND